MFDKKELIVFAVSMYLTVVDFSLHAKYQNGRKLPAHGKVFLNEWFPIHLLPSFSEKYPKLRFLWRFDFSLSLCISARAAPLWW